MDENQVALIQFKIVYGNNIIRSISYVQKFRRSELDILKEYFIESWYLKSEEYFSLVISKILFTYNVQSLDSKIKKYKFNKDIKAPQVPPHYVRLCIIGIICRICRICRICPTMSEYVEYVEYVRQGGFRV